MIDSGGYVLIKIDPDDPLASMADVRGYILEHRLLMARHIRRTLEFHEPVHHINGHKQDNRLSNLMLLTPAEHNRIHHLGRKKARPRL